jgi:peptidoglycan/xylan/chitin deacetylase (PgdA/CDA1 family)
VNEADWTPLRAELERWAQAARRPCFWIRDDDAVEPTQALDRLVRLANHFDIPLVVAAIPARATRALAARLATEPLVSVAVHGWSHENHAPSGKKQELGLHRGQEIVLRDLQRGLDQTGGLFGEQAIPLLVPPWNRIDAALLPALPGLGYRALSVYGPAKPAPLPMINSTVDIIDWHGTRGCLPVRHLVETIVAQLRAGFTSGDRIGVLTHHLVHDEDAWMFLKTLFELTANYVDWLGFANLMTRPLKPAS